MPAIFEEAHYSDYESGTDDPDSRTNLDQVKVRLSFESALRSPSMCNVIPDNNQGQEPSSSPRKHTVKSKSKSSMQQESVQLKSLEGNKQKKAAKQNGPTKDVHATETHRVLKEASHFPNKVDKKRERKGSKIPISTKEILKKCNNEETCAESITKQNGDKHRRHTKDNSASTQRGYRASKNKAEKASTKSDTLTAQSKSTIRSNSPPVPTLAKKSEKTMLSFTANTSGHSTDHNLPSLSAHTSKKAQQKAAKKLHSYSEDTSTPLANSVIRAHQSFLANHQHNEQMRPVSPPVPALAKKLQAQPSKKFSSIEFDSHNRSILPPIANDEMCSNDTFTPKQIGHNSQHVLSPVGYSGHPVVDFRSNSPPVPALAKQLSQQQSHTLNHNDNHLPTIASLNKDCNRPVSPELKSDSQFTYPPEMDEMLIHHGTNHKRHSLQQTQPVLYFPVSAHHQYQLPLYSHCSLDDPLCLQNSQQLYCVSPHVVSPVQIMAPPFSLSPPQPHHQQAGIEKRRESDNATVMTSEEDNSQLQCIKHEPSTTVDLSVQEQDSDEHYCDSKPLLHLPPIVTTTAQENEDKDHETLQSSVSLTATPQLSQQKEAVLQHLALMKKVQCNY